MTDSQKSLIEFQAYQDRITERRRAALWRQVARIKAEEQRAKVIEQSDRCWALGVVLALASLAMLGWMVGVIIGSL